MSCLEPRYRSVVWIEEWPSRNLICSGSPPLFRQSFAQVRRRSWAPKRSIPIFFDDCSTTDQTAHSLRVSRLTFPLLDRAQQRAVFDAGRDHPGVDALLDPDGDGNGADAPALALKVGQDPPSLSLLDGLDIELGQLVAPEGAADQQRQDDVVAFALQCGAVGDGQQLLRLLAGQPVAQPGSLLADVGRRSGWPPPPIRSCGSAWPRPPACGRPRAGRL